jgi:hypothetical protein
LLLKIVLDRLAIPAPPRAGRGSFMGGLDSLRPRHARQENQYDGEFHPRVTMRILRHSKIAVTVEIYTEAPSEATRDALRKLGGWLA